MAGMETLGLAESDSKRDMKVTEANSTAAMSESPLVRMVTLDTNISEETRQQEQPSGIMETLPTIMDTSELEAASPYPPPRLSHEHHVAGHDLVSHLHGLSPNPAGGPPMLPMRRLSRPSLGSRPSGTIRTSNVPFDEEEGWET